MRTSGVPQLQVWSVYMVISDTSYMIDGFTIALLTAEFGQVWAKLGLPESRTTLGEIARLT